MSTVAHMGHLAHCRSHQAAGQPVSGLKVAINALKQGIVDGVQAVVRSLSPSGPTAEQLPERGERSALWERHVICEKPELKM